ncbi:MAG: DUF2281 domain-containing protein [Phormidesmis sp.]
MQRIDIKAAQAEIAQLLAHALRGEEIIITQDNRPILKLTQVLPMPKRRQRGSAKGQIWMAPDFDEPLEDFSEYME